MTKPSNSALESAIKLDPIFQLAATSDGRQLVVRRGISEIASIDLETLDKRIVHRAESKRIVESRFSRDGATQLLLTDDGGVMIFRDKELLISHHDLPDPSNCCLSNDGTTAVIVMRGQNIRRWDLSDPNPTWSDYQLPESVHRMALAPEGDKLVVSTRQSGLQLYDAKTGIRVKTISDFEPVLCQPIFSDDGKFLAIAGSESVTLYDTCSFEVLWRTQTGPLDYSEALAISPDGRFIGLGSCKVGLQILESSRGDVLRRLSINGDDFVKTMAFSRSGDLLYTGMGGGRSIRVWSVPAGKELEPIN